MRKSGSHPDKALTALKVRTLSKAGRYADGNGLYLVVDASGAKRWMLRTVAQGRRRDVGLGSARLVSLAEARERAAALRKVARDGGDPVAERRRASMVVPTFEKAARKVHEDHKTGWRNGKHTDQWLNTLSQHVFPVIGNRPVNQIETSDVLRVLSPLWLTKAETARRIKQRIGLVLDWAKAAGHRSGDNPADGVSLGLPKQRDQRQHFKAMPYAEIPAFLKNSLGNRGCRRDSKAGLRVPYPDGRTNERGCASDLGRDRYRTEDLDHSGLADESRSGSSCSPDVTGD